MCLVFTVGITKFVTETQIDIYSPFQKIDLDHFVGVNGNVWIFDNFEKNWLDFDHYTIKVLQMKNNGQECCS